MYEKGMLVMQSNLPQGEGILKHTKQTRYIYTYIIVIIVIYMIYISHIIYIYIHI